jgi:hypothetical protein
MSAWAGSRGVGGHTDGCVDGGKKGRVGVVAVAMTSFPGIYVLSKSINSRIKGKCLRVSKR